MVLRHLLLNITTHDFCFVDKWMLAEWVLNIQRYVEGLIHAVIAGEIPRWRLMSTVLTLHEVPSIVGVGSERPAPQIGLQRTATIERSIGVGIVLSVVEETIDTAIDGGRQFLWNYLPLVVIVDIEEVTRIVGIGLCLKEMVTLTDVFFHIAMGIEAIIALPF